MLSDEDINYSLISAVREGNLERTRELINSYGLFYSRGWSGGYVLLRDAVENKHAAVAKLLLTSGSTVNSNSINPCDSPLHFAVRNGDIEIVKMLLDKGANIDAINEYRRTPLHIAIERKAMDVTELLLRHRADVNARDNEGQTPLHFVVEHAALHYTGSIEGVFGSHTNDDPYVYIKGEIAELLLSKGAIVDAQTENGETPLHRSAEKGDKQITIMLLNKGANVVAQTKNGETPLHRSAQRGNEEITIMLMDKGANVNAEKKDGTTPLHIAIQQGHKEVVKVLLEYGAKVNCKTKDDVTPLHLAAEKGYQEIIETVLIFGADINSRDKDGRSALHLASQGHLMAVSTLLEYGSDINITSRNNDTPLNHAEERIRLYYYDSDDDVDYNYYDEDDDYYNDDDDYNDYDDDDYDYYNDPDPGVCPCEVVAEALKRHIVKMKTANLYVSEKNLQSVDWRYEMSDFQDECEDEIASMKSEKINNLNISFYDILAKDKISLAVYMKNEDIVQVLKSDDYKTEFPIYAGMIETHFKKGMERKELLEQANNIFHFLFNSFPELPYDCTEKILSYLSDEELKNFNRWLQAS